MMNYLINEEISVDVTNTGSGGARGFCVLPNGKFTVVAFPMLPAEVAPLNTLTEFEPGFATHTRDPADVPPAWMAI